MKTIWKYELKIVDDQTIAMPEGAKILCVQTQYDNPCLWAEVESSASSCTRKFHISGTGHHLPTSDTLQYIGTFQIRDNALVFHVYEVV